MRRTVDLPADIQQLGLRVHHDEDVTVFLNGVKIAELTGYTTEYALVPLPEEAAQAAKTGENLLAVTCKQTGGGQYIDVGLVNLIPTKQTREVRTNKSK